MYYKTGVQYDVCDGHRHWESDDGAPLHTLPLSAVLDGKKCIHHIPTLLHSDPIRQHRLLP